MEESKEKLSLEQAFGDMEDGEVIGIIDLAEILGKLDEESLDDFMDGKLYDHIYTDDPEIGITLSLSNLYSVYLNLLKWSNLLDCIAGRLHIGFDSTIEGLAFRKILCDMDDCANNIFHVIK